MIHLKKYRLESQAIFRLDTVQYTGDVLQNCTPETCMIILTDVTLIHSIKKSLPLKKESQAILQSSV